MESFVKLQSNRSPVVNVITFFYVRGFSDGRQDTHLEMSEREREREQRPSARPPRTRACLVINEIPEKTKKPN